jgi:hypothetical protein
VPGPLVCRSAYFHGEAPVAVWQGFFLAGRRFQRGRSRKTRTHHPSAPTAHLPMGGSLPTCCGAKGSAENPGASFTELRCVSPREMPAREGELGAANGSLPVGAPLPPNVWAAHKKKVGQFCEDE